MRPAGCEPDLLRALASMPFLHRLEMVAVCGWSRGAVYEAVEKLESGGFCASVPHAVDPLPPARRFHLTAAGLCRLAEEEGIALDELVRSRPVSAQWRRSLMERLDPLASVYHVASALSNVAYPIRFRWYRAMPMDAAMTLPDGRTVGIIRQGLTADRSGFAKRLWRLRDWPMPGTALILVADDVRLRHASVGRSPPPTLPALLALEREVVLAGAGDRIWSPVKVSAAIDLRYELAPGGPRGRAAAGAGSGAGRPPHRPSRQVGGVGHIRPYAARHPQVRREARPRPDLGLALDRSQGSGRADGRLASGGSPRIVNPLEGLRPREPAPATRADASSSPTGR